MVVERISEGLWRWTAPHPDWTPESGGTDGWGPDVGCVYAESEGEIVLIDPLVSLETEERDRFWLALDRDVERVGSPPSVVLTVHWHARSARDVLARYPGARVYAPAVARADFEPRTTVTHWYSPQDPLPIATVAYATASRGEVVYWLPNHATLVPGDVLLGAEDGGLRLCPPDWLADGETVESLRASLRPLLELPVERVLVAHGAPLLSGGLAALELALAE